MTTHIVTMGGGGFSMSENGAPTNLDRYLVELTGKRTPMVCFAPTASADDAQVKVRFTGPERAVLSSPGRTAGQTLVLDVKPNQVTSVRVFVTAPEPAEGVGGPQEAVFDITAGREHETLPTAFDYGDADR